MDKMCDETVRDCQDTNICKPPNQWIIRGDEMICARPGELQPRAQDMLCEVRVQYRQEAPEVPTIMPMGPWCAPSGVELALIAALLKIKLGGL